jgi:hypothetical protein
MYEQEEWRPVVGYEGRYEVSSHGRVKRLAFTGKSNYQYPEKMIAPSMSCGYPFVGMRDADGKQNAPRVHVLVAEAFIGKRPKGKVVNHIDFDKTNNHVSNLEYVTNRENIQHSARYARHKGALTMDQVQALRSLVERDPAIDLEYVAQRLGVHVYSLCAALECRTYSLVPNKDGSLPTPIKYTYCKTICLEDIQDFLALGFSVPQISKYYKVDYSTPYQMLRRADIWQVESAKSIPSTGARMHKAKSQKELTR